MADLLIPRKIDGDNSRLSRNYFKIRLLANAPARRYPQTTLSSSLRYGGVDARFHAVYNHDGRFSGVHILAPDHHA